MTKGSRHAAGRYSCRETAGVLKQLGGGKGRFMGQPKTKAQLQLGAAVANLTLIAAWIEAISEEISSVLRRLIRRAVSAARAARFIKTTCPLFRSASASF